MKKIWENAGHMHVPFKRLTPETPIPEYKTSGAAAFDLAVIEEGVLAPGERKLFRTGLVVRVPPRHVLLLAPRSSNAKKGIRLANGVGIIDEDYCGPEDEIRLFLHNTGDEAYTIEPGERLAQGVFIPIPRATFEETPLWHAAPNRGGFGTTG